jgi:hypothetical protein
MRLNGGKRGVNKPAPKHETSSDSTSPNVVSSESCDDCASSSHSDSEGEFQVKQESNRPAQRPKRGTQSKTQPQPSRSLSSSEEVEPDLSSVDPKRKRVFRGKLARGLSCTNCRRSHASCDGLSPCGRCQRSRAATTCVRVSVKLSRTAESTYPGI